MKTLPQHQLAKSFVPNEGAGSSEHAATQRVQAMVADWSASLAAVSELPSATRQDVVDALDLARRFNTEVIRPRALALDAAMQDNPDLLAHDYVAEANRWGLYSLWLPKMFGGGGWNLLSLYVFIEEISAECVALANTFGVHYLGVSTLMATWNMKLIHRIFSEVSAAQHSGQPCLISLAITEPNAGTDVEECELLDRARLGTVARPQPGGGYSLTGRKIFISNGHVSTWHMVVAYEDRARAADTMVILAVKNGTPGFSFGAKENKMGQKACVASELLFEDCIVPPSQVALSPAVSERSGRSHREVAQVVIDYVVSSTRAGVGAFATGTAKGALNAALAYAAAKRVQGCAAPGASGGAFGGASGGVAPGSAEQPTVRLIDQQWAQTLLADMAKNASLARQAYMESAFANSLGGLFQITFVPLIYALDHRIPKWLMKPHTSLLFSMDWVTHGFQKHYLGRYPHVWEELTSGMASLAKVACSDFAVTNANLAIDLMGADGLRHEYGVEKRLRDAKLLQIYEGTNQLNRVNLFKCLLKPDSRVSIFAREGGQ